MVLNCYSSNVLTGGFGVEAHTASGIVSGVEVRGGAGTAVGIYLNGQTSLSNFIVSGMPGVGISINGATVHIERGIIYGGSTYGVDLGGQDNVFVGNVHCEANGDLGFHATTANATQRIVNCSGYNNTNGNLSAGLNSTPAIVQGFIACSASAINNAGTHDFGINNTATGGALLRAAGFPGVYPGGTTTSYMDVGAAQTQTVAASGGGVPGNIMRVTGGTYIS